MADPAAGASTDSIGSDPLWDEWDTPPRVPDSPELHLAGFDGPMGLLLDLAERQRIDLGRISILQLVEQFLAGMTQLERHVSLERRADWLVMATRLLLLRSRLLFPANPRSAAEAAQEAHSEAHRLEQMMLVRAAATWLEQRPQLGCDVFARPQGRHPRVSSYMALMEACLAVLRGREGQAEIEPDMPAGETAPLRLFRTSEAIARIRAVMAERDGEEIGFGECLPSVSRDDPQLDLRARSAVASTLTAVLELARVGEVIAMQSGENEAIRLTSALLSPGGCV